MRAPAQHGGNLLTLPGDVFHSTAAAIVGCYAYLIWENPLWLANLPDQLQHDIITEIESII
jgi:hypothetical protein